MHEVKVTRQLKLHFWLTQLFMLLNIIVQIDGLAIFDKNFTKLSLAHGEDIVKKFEECGVLIRSTYHLIG